MKRIVLMVTLVISFTIHAIKNVDWVAVHYNVEENSIVAYLYHGKYDAMMTKYLIDGRKEVNIYERIDTVNFVDLQEGEFPADLVRILHEEIAQFECKMESSG